jgi:hypothetical protein
MAIFGFYFVLAKKIVNTPTEFLKIIMQHVKEQR